MKLIKLIALVCLKILSWKEQRGEADFNEDTCNKRFIREAGKAGNRNGKPVFNKDF
jgi:hypothetical protein